MKDHPYRVPALAWVIAAVFVATELAVSARYGFLQDELYFIAAGHHLAFGYVDQPPLAPLLTRVTGIVGVHPTVIRIIPALAGGAVVVIAARLAALFGAGRAGRIIAALLMACAPVLLAADHIANTTPYDLLAWAVVLLIVATAVLTDRPRWWLGAGLAAGVGLETDNLVALLIGGLLIGMAAGGRTGILRTRWPWLGAAIALAIWAPNLIWQAVNGWPQLAMASALRQQNDSASAYAGGLVAQLVVAVLLVAPFLIAGFIKLWRSAELRFLAIAATLTVGYVLAWVPGKVYYPDGVLPLVLAAGAVSAENWIARARHARLRRGLVIAAPLAGTALLLPFLLPLLPVGDLHAIKNLHKTNPTLVNTIGWPQFTAMVAAQDAALTRAGQRPTSIFTGAYAEAAALQVLGAGDHLPPVISGHNAYWTWGPGRASDRRVLVIDALSQVRPYFASCRVLTRYRVPYRVRNDYSGLGVALCTGPLASWQALWPRLKHYN